MSADFDLHHSVKVSVGMTQQTINTDTVTTGEIIDTALFGSIEFIYFTGTITAAGGVGLIQEGDDAALSDAATATDILGSVTISADADDDAVFRMGYNGSKRYVRAAFDSDATMNGVLGVVAVQANPVTGPVAEQAT